MRQSCRAHVILLVGLTLCVGGAPPLFAQTPAVAETSSRAAWLPGVSLGAGMASVGTERTPWNAPMVASLRVELTKFLVAEVEWTQPMRASTFREIIDLGQSTLNGQSGIYGHETQLDEHRLRITNVSLLARSQMDRFSFFVGGGISRFQSSIHTVSTWTGCTGPWVAHCQRGNGESTYDRTAADIIVVGGFDFRLHPRLDLFVAGRIGGSNAGEEGAIAAGVRTALVPDRHRRGWTKPSSLSRSPLRDVRAGDTISIVFENGSEEKGTVLGANASSVTIRTKSRVVSAPLASIRAVDKEDSLVNGVIMGLVGGGALGLYIATYDERRTLPAAMLAGAALGAFIDALSSHPRYVYRRMSPVAVMPVVSPSGVKLGVNVTWK